MRETLSPTSCASGDRIIPNVDNTENLTTNWKKNVKNVDNNKKPEQSGVVLKSFDHKTKKRTVSYQIKTHITVSLIILSHGHAIVFTYYVVPE